MMSFRLTVSSGYVLTRSGKSTGSKLALLHNHMLVHELDRDTLEVIDLGNGQLDIVAHVRLAEGIRWAIGTQDVMVFGRPIGPVLRSSLQ
jgi:hypothetical protein